jgi:hypothetical protein
VPQYPVQMGLFGGFNQLAGLHVVDAHTRVLADGTQVYVSEHLRWNRGRQGPRSTTASDPEPSDDQLSLFRPR